MRDWYNLSLFKQYRQTPKLLSFGVFFDIVFYRLDNDKNVLINFDFELILYVFKKNDLVLEILSYICINFLLMKKLVFVSLGVLFTCMIQAQSLTPFVVSSSGGFFGNSSGSLSFTIAEMTMTETFSGSSGILTLGFQQPEVVLSSLDESDPINVSVFPNPTNGQFSLIVNSAGNERAIVHVYDLLGQTIIEQVVNVDNGTNNFTFDLRGYSSGVYMLNYHNSAGNKTVKFTITNK